MKYKIYLDTSIINRILADERKEEIIFALTAKYKPNLSLYNIVELASTDDPQQRKDLLEIANRIIRRDRPLAEQQIILRRFFKNMHSFKIPKKGSKIIRKYLNGNITNADYQNAKEWKTQLEDNYRRMHDNARPSVQEKIEQISVSEKTSLKNISKFLKHILSIPLFKEVCRDLMRSASKSNKFDRTAVRTISLLEPWRFFLVAFGIGIYNRSLKQQNYGRRNNTGAIDNNQAIYLAYCDIFVTADKPQRKMLRLAVPFGFKRRKVWSYEQLKNDLFD